MPGLLLPTASNVRPSYKSGFARSSAESSSPGLWDGLVGAWSPFVGNTGTVLRDLSGRGNHGTLTNMELSDWAHTEYGTSLNLGGTDEYISVPFEDIPEPFTLFSQYRMTENSTYKFVLSIGGSGSTYYGLGWTLTTDFPYLRHYDGTSSDATYSVAANFDEWMTSAGVLQSLSERHFYHNGILRDTNTDTQNHVVCNNLTIGASADTSPLGYITGDVGTQLIYSRALLPYEIAELNRDPLAPFRLRRFTPTFSGAAEEAAEWQPYWGLHATRFAGILT